MVAPPREPRMSASTRSPDPPSTNAPPPTHTPRREAPSPRLKTWTRATSWASGGRRPPCPTGQTWQPRAPATNIPARDDTHKSVSGFCPLTAPSHSPSCPHIHRALFSITSLSLNFFLSFPFPPCPPLLSLSFLPPLPPSRSLIALNSLAGRLNCTLPFLPPTPPGAFLPQHVQLPPRSPVCIQHTHHPRATTTSCLTVVPFPSPFSFCRPIPFVPRRFLGPPPNAVRPLLSSQHFTRTPASFQFARATPSPHTPRPTSLVSARRPTRDARPRDHLLPSHIFTLTHSDQASPAVSSSAPLTLTPTPPPVPREEGVRKEQGRCFHRKRRPDVWDPPRRQSVRMSSRERVARKRLTADGASGTP